MRRESIGDRIFTGIIYIIITLLCISTLVPIWNVFVQSITPATAASLSFQLWPKAVDFGAWRSILSSSFMWQSFFNTVVRTVLGTALSVVATVMTAYPLSRKDFPGRKYFMFMITFTMIFNGGMIPTFLLVKNLNLIDTLWALILPTALTPFNVILMRNFFNSIPSALEESATIDGANDVQIFTKIVLPLSLPSIATITLWIAVGHWNAWFDVVLYINDRSKYVLQMVLREFQSATVSTMDLGDTGVIPPTTEAVQSASTLFVVIPILCVYPFLQKYFIKGVTVGAVKE